jgi:hypothetical protein
VEGIGAFKIECVAISILQYGLRLGLCTRLRREGHCTDSRGLALFFETERCLPVESLTEFNKDRIIGGVGN